MPRRSVRGRPSAPGRRPRHPEQIGRLVFYGSHPGHRAVAVPEDEGLDETFTQLIKVGWERPTPEFRRVFTYLMIPGATEEQMGWLDDAPAPGRRRPTSPSAPGRRAVRPTSATCSARSAPPRWSSTRCATG